MGEAVRLLAAAPDAARAPHLPDEISEAYGATESTVRAGLADFDPALVVDDVLPYAVQVNGKLRGEIKRAGARRGGRGPRRRGVGRQGEGRAVRKDRPQGGVRAEAADQLRGRMEGGLLARASAVLAARAAACMRFSCRRSPSVAPGASATSSPRWWSNRTSEPRPGGRLHRRPPRAGWPAPGRLGGEGERRAPGGELLSVSAVVAQLAPGTTRAHSPTAWRPHSASASFATGTLALTATSAGAETTSAAPARRRHHHRGQPPGGAAPARGDRWPPARRARLSPPAESTESAARRPRCPP